MSSGVAYDRTDKICERRATYCVCNMKRCVYLIILLCDLCEAMSSGVAYDRTDKICERRATY